MSREKKGTILLVTHGHFIRELLLKLINFQLKDDDHLCNCGRTLINFGDEIEMEYFNEPLA
jgi:broad specificity phosphatase PhoE